MRRSVTWFVLSLLCVVGLILFWRARHESKNQATQSTPEVQTGSIALSAPSPLAKAPTNVHATAWVTRGTNWMSYIFRNTTKTADQITHHPHIISLENAKIDTEQLARGAKLNFNIPEHLRMQGDPGTYIVQARQQPDNQFRAALASAGATIISFIPNNSYLVRMNASGAQQMESQAQAVLPYEPVYKLKANLLKLAVDDGPLPPETVLNVSVFSDARADTIADLERTGAEILAESRSPFGPLLVVRPPSKWTDIALLSGVQMLELFRERVPANDLMRARMGVAANTTVTNNYLNLTGTNVLVAVNDTGISYLHPDLTNRVIADVPSSLVDTNGHGTHVAATIAGSGAVSATVSNVQGSVTPTVDGQFRGMAPQARLFSAAIANGIIRSDTYLQEAASTTNALISNNSWNYSGDTTYSMAAASYDAAVRDALPAVVGSQPMVFVFPAGNQGDGNNDGLAGSSDSILSPATAKNVLTIGAIEQLRNITNTVNLDPTLTNVAVWQPRTDTDFQVTSSSGRGNVGVGIEGPSGRFKPDLVAPGTFVLSARSLEWDEKTYYGDIQSLVVTNTGIGIVPNGYFTNQVFLPPNIVFLIVAVVPNTASPTNLIVPVYVNPGGPGAPVGVPFINGFISPGDLPLTPVNTSWGYVLQNTNSQNINFDLITILGLTNTVGDYYIGLSNLNSSIAGTNSNFYRYEGDAVIAGTSMAAAGASGTLALLEDFFTNNFSQVKTIPSPALLKAMLINGARSVSGLYDLQVAKTRNFQGWGLINLPNSLPSDQTNVMNGIKKVTGTPSSVLLFDQDGTNALATGQSHTRFISLPNEDAQFLPLRFTLVWTDPPGNPVAGRKLVNDLNLVVTNIDTGEVYVGNNIPGSSAFTVPWNPADTNSVAPIADAVNNVENVFIFAPFSGTNFSVTVYATNVNVNAVSSHPNDTVQDYALVVSSGDGELTNALTFDLSKGVNGLVTNAPIQLNIAALALVLSTNSNTVASTNVTGQRVGANTPLLGTTNGMTNQWHFYVIPDSTGFTNFAFGTDLARNLSIPRIGTRERFVINAARADNGVSTADIDLYVSTEPGLTNLDPVVIANAAKSLGRGGVETVFLTNVTPGPVFYVGVKSEDQMAAEYTFFAAASLGGFGGDGPTILEGSEVIPDGNAALPGHTLNLRALWNKDGQIRRVIVTNSIFSENLGDLVGTMYTPGNGKFVTLNNHRVSPPGSYTFIYEDNGEETYFDNGITSLRHTDGPGSLTTYIGEPNPKQWYFEFLDDHLTETGVVQNIGIRVDTENPEGSGFECIRGGGIILHSVNVPGNAINLSICLDLTNALGPLELYIKKGAPPTATDFDVHQTVLPPSGCASVSQASTPPLSAGRYFWMVSNTSSNEQCYSYRTSIELAGSSSQPVVRTTLTNAPVRDDSVGTYYLTNNSHSIISSIDVGLLIRHPRISDLAITLVAPNGTRILLFEDRGMLTPDGLGTLGTLFPTTNLVAYYTNDFDAAPVGLYAHGATFQGWNVFSNLVSVMDDFQCLCLSNHMLVLGYGSVTNAFPLNTNSTEYQLSFKVTHAPYLVGMVGWWPFDKSGRDIFGGMDALMCCNILYATGMVNQAYYSDGLGTVAKVPGGPPIDVGARWPHSLTIEGWINPANVTNAAPLVEWNQSTNLVNPLGVQFWIAGQFTTNAAAPPGTLAAAIWDQNQNLPPNLSTVATVATTPMAITNGGWQHVAFTYDANSGLARLFVNGNPVANNLVGTLSPRTWGDLYFGFQPAGPSAGTHFAGGMDEFALYDRALTDCEIMAIYSVTNRGKYGTNVLTCPVSVQVDTPGFGLGTYTFDNGAAWSTNGLSWETNTIVFNLPAVPGSTNLLPIIVRSTNANVALDQFVLTSTVTNTIEGLMHFVEDTNLTQTLIKFAPYPFTAVNFQPFVVLTNDFETATQSVYVANDIIRGSPQDPAIGQRDWRVALRPASAVSVVSNANFSATGSNWVSLARGAIQCELPTRTGHRYELSYTLRGPCAVSWWNGEIEPLSQRARDVISANHGAFLHYATNSTSRRFVGNTLHLPGMITNIPPGVDDIAGKIELGDPFNLRFTNAMTLEGWIYPTLPDTWPTNGLPSQEQIFFRGDQRTCADPYYLALTDFLFESPTQVRANLRFHIDNIADGTFNSCGVDLFTTNWPIAFDQWQHIAAVFEAVPPMTNNWWYTNVMRLYTNGVQLTNIVWVNAQSLAYGTNGLQPFRDLEPDYSPGITIGNRSRADASQPYSGNIDEFTAYARALTQPELQAIAAARTAGKFDPAAAPTLSLARARVALNGVEVDRAYADNSEWATRVVPFTANGTNMTLTLESLLPGTLVDEIILTEVPQELYYLPEESLASLLGMDGFGVWQLEIWDTRTGSYLTDTELVKWQLDLRLVPQNLPPVVPLAFGIPYTNSIGPNGIQYFTVEVPQWATMATNILAFARQFGTLNPAPVTVLFNQTNQPNIADVALIGPASTGTNIMTTNGTPPLVVGQTYYLAVTNPNPFGVSFALNVFFDIPTLPTCEAITNVVGPAGIPRYFQFDVDTNSQSTTLWVYGANTNLSVVLSQRLPLPDLAHQDYLSARPSTNNEIVMVLTNSTPFPLQPNRWYVGVYNSSGGDVPFTIQACPSNYPTIIKLTNSIPFDAFFANSNALFIAPPGPPRTVFYEFDINDFEDAVLFELYGLSGNADLVLQRYVPPGMAPYYKRSFQLGTNAEQIVLRNNFDVPDLRGKWFLGVYNNEATNVQYTIRASLPTNGVLVSGQPIVITNSPPVPPSPGNILSWNAVEGESYIIQYATLPTPPPGIVSVGPVMNTNNNHFYYILWPTNWLSAEAEAVSLGGHLVTIDDAVENAWLLNVLVQPYDSLWIGLNDITTEGNYVWTSGAPVNYLNWLPGEPNGGPAENATAMGGLSYAVPGGWFDNPVGQIRPAIVEASGFLTNWITLGSQIAASSCATFVAPCFGPVSWWPGESSSRDVIDGNHGTLVNGAGYVAGRFGTAFGFDGVNDSVVVPPAPNLDVGNQVTLEFWMNADVSNPMNTCCQGLLSSDFYLVEISRGLSPLVGVNFAVSTTAGAAFVHTADANGGGAQVTAGQWHHIAGTYDGMKLQLYVDGLPWGRPLPHSGAISLMLPGSSVNIGSEDGRMTCGCIGRYFKGLIDEPAIYNRALSAAEIQAIYLSNSSSKCAVGVTFRAVQVPQFPTIPLPPYRPVTNTIAQNSTQVFSVRVPSWAMGATNQLITASGPVNVIFNQFIPPTAPGDITLQVNVTTGTNTLLTSGTTPPLVPGSRYFLAVQNPGVTPVQVVLEVDFDYTQLTNGVPINSLADSPSLQRYFYYDVSTNATLVTYELYNMSGNVDLVGRVGPPLPDLTSFSFAGFNPGTLDENILIYANSTPAITPGRTYLGVFDQMPGPASYTIRATEYTNPIPSITTLTNGIAYCTTNTLVPTDTDYYHFVVTNGAVRAQFEINNPSGDMTLVVRKGLPLPATNSFDYISTNALTNDELIVVLTNSSPVNLLPGDWFISAINVSGAPVSYCIKATQWGETGRPFTITNAYPAGNTFCLTWNSLPGVHYFVQGLTSLSSTNWQTVSPTITAIDYSTTWCISLPSAFHFFRVVEGLALVPAVVAPPAPPPTIISITRTNNAVVLVFTGGTNESYRVQWSPTLPPVWNTFTNTLSSPTGLFNFVDDGTQTGGLGPMRFYRVYQL